MFFPAPKFNSGVWRRFLLLAAGLYLLWFFGYEQWLGPDGRLDALLTANMAGSSAVLLRVAGFAATVGANPMLVLMDTRPFVYIGSPYNGLAIYALFAGFILAYPGPTRTRLWLIPVGIAGLYLLNLLRVGVLVVNQYYAYHAVAFSYYYGILTVLVYGCIFSLWLYWVRQQPQHPPTVGS
ncbi:hypothetical protein H8B15_08155 [Hymenobacter sp. BT507]|uniref:Exosortase/archaeosortase family protein n=1 Tax=Hymenobacter citatus TaxID=2763506 RepID=A0ABR7MIW3_9BACT|nr:hypothetical protein [Hymenobacter citatus]MBC6610893.1 hypothetical protein [Hymenobacter citatus]